MSDKPASILVVDDDEAKRYAVVRLLSNQGFAVSVAESGAEALEKARARPDLVVLDVKLPDMSGFEICRRLKRDHATSGILVLHMSATLVEPQHRVEGLNAGADGYLTDAVDPSEFLATVRALLRARNAERALRETEKRFETLVRCVEEYAIFTCNAAGSITSWNEGVERIFGYTAEQFVNRPYASLFSADDDARNDLERARHDGQIAYDRWHERPDGRRFFAAGSVAAICDDDGDLLGFVNIARDATARHEFEEQRAALLAAEQRAREEAEHISRLKDDFLATLSHELRTPLSAILGWTQLLKIKRLSSEEVHEGVAVIDRNARAQAKLIEDLLDVTRIMSGKLRLQVEQVDLAAAISAAIESGQTAADAKQISISGSCDADAVTISGDPTRVQQILWNLLSNAIKFTPPEGKVTVSAQRTGDEVEIRVADTGQGIDAPFLPFVFDRFRQADASTTRAHGGLGLGLAIVRHLAELHGGSAHAESAGKGLGSVFRVRLPVAAQHSVDEDDEMTVARTFGMTVEDGPPPDLTGLAILIVEDNADTRELLRKILAGCGASVRTASSAEEAMRAFIAERPDLLLCDIGMPHEDGYTFIRRIRAFEDGSIQPVPAIALTAFAQSEDRRHALRSGFQMHVPKPVIPSELLAVVGTLCGRRGRRIVDS